MLYGPCHLLRALQPPRFLLPFTVSPARSRSPSPSPSFSGRRLGERRLPAYASRPGFRRALRQVFAVPFASDEHAPDKLDVFPETVTSKTTPTYQVEQDVETVIHVLQPGPIGIVEHKFTDAEILEARATVKRTVDNWRRIWTLERNLGSTAFDK